MGASALLPAHSATTLKIATSVPAGTSFIKVLKKAGHKIKAKTDGAVELDLYPGGVMGDNKTVLRKIRIGQLDGAVITAAGLKEIDADAQIYSLPFLFRNHAELNHVREQIDPIIRKRIRANGFIVAGISEGGFTYLFSKDPIRNLDDLSEATVWVPEGDQLSARMFKKAGSDTVSLPISDVYTSLQTGLIDTVAVNPAGAVALQWHTAVDHYTDAPLLMLVGMLVIDEDSFQGIDKADRKTVRSIFEKTFEHLDAVNREDNADAMQAMHKLGIDAVEPSKPPDQRRWQTIARETLQSMEEQTDLDAELLQRVRGLVKDYRRKHDNGE